MPRRPARLAGRVFRASDVLREGLLTEKQLRGPAWRRVLRDVYADSCLPNDHRLRCEAAALVIPPRAAISGRSAACMRGLPLGAPDDPVLVLVPPPVRFGPAAGLAIRRVTLPDEDVLNGWPHVTAPVRTALEVAREPDVVEAVVGLDMMLGTGYVDVAELRARAAGQRRSRAFRAVALADGRAESPQESRLRVRLTQAGLPAPVPQHVVRTSGLRFVARVDLAWPGERIALEYDGAWHASTAQLRRDRARLNALLGLQWRVFHATARTLTSPASFRELTAHLRAALSLGTTSIAGLPPSSGPT